MPLQHAADAMLKRMRRGHGIDRQKRVVARLRESYAIPDGMRCVDGGTLGLSLLAYLEDARKVILVDAVAADAPPGVAGFPDVAG